MINIKEGESLLAYIKRINPPTKYNRLTRLEFEELMVDYYEQLEKRTVEKNRNFQKELYINLLDMN